MVFIHYVRPGEYKNFATLMENSRINSKIIQNSLVISNKFTKELRFQTTTDSFCYLRSGKKGDFLFTKHKRRLDEKDKSDIEDNSNLDLSDENIKYSYTDLINEMDVSFETVCSMFMSSVLLGYINLSVDDTYFALCRKENYICNIYCCFLLQYHVEEQHLLIKEPWLLFERDCKEEEGDTCKLFGEPIITSTLDDKFPPDRTPIMDKNKVVHFDLGFIEDELFLKICEDKVDFMNQLVSSIRKLAEDQKKKDSKLLLENRIKYARTIDNQVYITKKKLNFNLTIKDQEALEDFVTLLVIIINEKHYTYIECCSYIDLIVVAEPRDFFFYYHGIIEPRDALYVSEMTHLRKNVLIKCMRFNEGIKIMDQSSPLASDA